MSTFSRPQDARPGRTIIDGKAVLIRGLANDGDLINEVFVDAHVDLGLGIDKGAMDKDKTGNAKGKKEIGVQGDTVFVNGKNLIGRFVLRKGGKEIEPGIVFTDVQAADAKTLFSKSTRVYVSFDATKEAPSKDWILLLENEGGNSLVTGFELVK